MKQLIGFILVITGVIFGVWAGLWWAFIGGIVDVINAAEKTPNIVAMDIAIGLAKIFFAGPIGTLVTFFAIMPGWSMLQD